MRLLFGQAQMVLESRSYEDGSIQLLLQQCFLSKDISPYLGFPLRPLASATAWLALGTHVPILQLHYICNYYTSSC
jgi:hypothetical protein